MSLTKHPNYDDVWVATYYPEGRKKDPKTGKPNNKRERILLEGTRAEAEIQYAKILKAAMQQQAPKIALNLAEAWPDFLVDYTAKSRPRTATSAAAIWSRQLKKFFGPFRPGLLSVPLIEKYKVERIKTVKPKTVNNELDVLAAIIRWGVNNHKWSPLPFKIPKFPPKMTASPKPRVPSPNQVKAVLAALGQRHFEFYSILYGCGLRLTEAKNLKVEDVNIDARYIVIGGKGGRERFFPIPLGLIDLLSEIIERVKTGYLWLNPDTNQPYSRPGDALKTAAKRAGVNLRMYPHLLRHAFGVHGLLAGMNLRAVQLLMGHTTSKTTEIYTELALEHLREELAKF